MNIKNLSELNIKEDNIKKNLENVALKIKAESCLEELDQKSEEIIKILEKFSEKIPTMITSLETINKGLRLDFFSNTLEKIERNSQEMIRLSKSMEYENKTCIETIKKTSIEEISILSKKAEENINKREKIFSFFDKVFLISIVITILINIVIAFYFTKKFKEISYETYKIHQILMKEKQYWGDSENHKIYIK